MNAEQILKILKTGSAEDRENLVQNCPANTFKDTVLPLVGSDHPGTVVVALAQLIVQYCSGQNPSVGAPLAVATHTYALEIFESGSDPGLLATTLSNLAFQYVNALNLLGRSEEVISFTNQYIPYYERIGENENLPSLKAAKINALINLNQIDEADQMLQDPNIRGNWATDIEIERLENKLAILKKRITETKAEEDRTQEAGYTGGAELIDKLKNAISHSIENKTQREELLKAADKLDPSNRIDPNSDEGFQQLLDLLKTGEQIITGDSTEESEWTIKKKIREASAIFRLEEKPSPEKIGQSLAILEQSLEWARENTFFELANDALWGIYLCHSRLNQPSPAADAVLQIRENLEATRRGISDPLERGGVFSNYSHLFDVLCEKLHIAGRAEELLEAIEASKGRGIADILTQKSGNAVADASIYDAVKALPDLIRREGFHYLTYYVDTDRTYAVMVDKEGHIHSFEPVPISKSAIRDASQFVDPVLWGEPSDYDASYIIGDVSVVLAPLVKFLEPLLDQGIMEVGDHISYSADDNFNNIPLQYLIFKGKPLIDTFSLSRIQNAFHLKQILSKPAMNLPTEFISFIVPTQQNLQNDYWPKMVQGLRQPTSWLQAHLNGQVFENEMGAIEEMKRQDLNHKVMQFSTHGVFPTAQETQNPFYHSGLVLSNGKDLPDEDAVGQGNQDHLLTPSTVLDLKLDFTHSHLSLMACVSGLSREGLGGDALGMDWAFIQAGAASLLSSHWYVSTALAAVFFEQFYDHWINRRKSRAQAYCDTIHDLRGREGGLSGPGSWAAFSLTGDWR